ncbi:MAG: aspartate-semialdehyde dehydrogenase [Thermodesulfobacteriota bacterium]|nr:aspartate-semialdehyde dehydrogenase [Thermodesulfobacteriota bacterium]
MKKEKYNIAVAGATGAVGNEIIKILEERSFPVRDIRLLASSRSAGFSMEFKNRERKVELISEDSFQGIDIGLFSAGGSVSEKYAPIAADSGCIVVDNTSVFRMDPHVPLVVPEVNPHAIAEYVNKGIIANPNCSTIQMVVVLKPIHDIAKIKRVVVSTYQAVSGTGKKALDELLNQTRDILNFQDVECEVYPHQIAFNCLPHIDVFLEDGYTKEEMKMVNETRKILEDDSIGVTATTVRVPVFYGHSESVNIETEKKITEDNVRELLSNAPGVTVLDDPSSQGYPLAINAAGMDDTFVGRIREDYSIEKGINMWIVADNIRKGAALNAVQIAEILINEYL